MSLKFQTLAVRSGELGTGRVLKRADDLDFGHWEMGV